MCLFPKLIKNRKYLANKKNGGNVPPLPLREFHGKMIPDERVLMVPVGCGKCMECSRKKAREWQVRLLEEIKYNTNGLFVTLTFSNESILELSKSVKNLSGYERDNEIGKIAVQRFFNRWRKETKKRPKHFLISELGHNGTENLHFHGIIWTDRSEEWITKKWGYGYTWTNEGNGNLNDSIINYIIKYVTKVDEKNREYKPIIMVSNGLGKKYTNSYNAKLNKYNENTREYYTTRTGHKMSLPIYYRNKIYNDNEREKLWIKKLDENIRYVDGVKIDISKNEEYYYKMLDVAREKNKRLGYGNNEKNWERKRYENERRNLKFIERLSNATDVESAPHDEHSKAVHIASERSRTNLKELF